MFHCETLVDRKGAYQSTTGCEIAPATMANRIAMPIRNSG